MKSRIGIPAFIVATVFVSSIVDAQTNRDLSTYIPEEANFLVMVNEAELFESPLAKKLKWADERRDMVDAGDVVIPQGTQDYLLAGAVDIENGIPDWEIALIRKSGFEKFANLARSRAAEEDSVSGKKAFAIGGDTWWVRVEDDLVGSIYPANRQSVARWINRFETNTTCLVSSYLCRAAGYASDKKTHVIVSMDLNDAFSKNAIKQQLASVGESGNSELEELLSSVRGTMLGITFTDRVNAKLIVDFDKDATAFRSVGKKLISDFLGQHGMMMDEIESWTPQVKGNRFTLSGSFNDKSLRNLATMMQPVGLGANTMSELTYTPGGDATANSVNYLKALFSFHDEIMKHDKETARLHSYWIERMAHQIDELSVVGVDDEVVTFSEDLTSQYHKVIEMIAYERSAAKFRKASNYSGYSGYRNWRSRYYRNSTQTKRITQQEEAKAEFSVAQKLIEIEDMAKRFRNDMSQKFEIDF